jgi:hypothetical protein
LVFLIYVSRREEANYFASVKDKKGFSLGAKRARKAPADVIGESFPTHKFHSIAIVDIFL